jgi:hypothetical protein
VTLPAALRRRWHERYQGAVTKVTEMQALIETANQKLEGSAFDHAAVTLP